LVLSEDFGLFLLEGLGLILLGGLWMKNDLADVLEREPRGLGNFRRRVSEKVAVQMDVQQIHQTRDFVGQLRPGR
jgi:hypothetical protein